MTFSSSGFAFCSKIFVLLWSNSDFVFAIPDDVICHTFVYAFPHLCQKDSYLLQTWGSICVYMPGLFMNKCMSLQVKAGDDPHINYEAMLESNTDLETSLWHEDGWRWQSYSSLSYVCPKGASCYQRAAAWEPEDNRFKFQLSHSV